MSDLGRLREAMATAARSDTAYAEYDPGISPLHGHCGAVAHLVQSKFGGEILSGTVDGQRHFWNRLPSGEEIDLTSDQFGGDGRSPLRPGAISPARKTTNLRFRVFAERVERVLANPV